MPFNLITAPTDPDTVTYPPKGHVLPLNYRANLFTTLLLYFVLILFVTIF